MEALRAGIWRLNDRLAQRIQNFLVFLVQSRRDTIASIAVVDRAWPPTFSADKVPWRRRTKNCLARVGMQRRLTELQQITFGDLFAIPSMGPLSILDFACTLEATLNEYQPGPRSLSEAAGEITGSTTSERNFSAILLKVLEEPWSDWISEQDPRFAGLLPPGHGTLTERIDLLSSALETRDADFDALASAVPQIRDQVTRITSLPLEAAIRDYVGVASGVRDKRLPALLARLHWDGTENGKTLEEAGHMIGVTRERIRQLQKRLYDRLPTHPVLMPALDRALAVLAAKAPIHARAAAELLREERISERPFHPSSLLAVAQGCGRTPSMHLDHIRGHELVTLDAAQAYGDVIISVAHAQARGSGTSNIADVVAETSSRYGLEIPAERVQVLLQRFGDVEFLDDQWFWCPTRGGDYLRTVSRKMLSVASPIEISVLREGVRRAFKFRSISGAPRWRSPTVPPRQILAAYYRAHPDFVMGDDGMVRSARPLNYRSELAGVEQVIVTVLRASPTNILERAELLERCIERGVNLSSLQTFLSYSPVVERLGAGIWSLRGIKVDPAVVQAMREANALRPRVKRVIDFGWTSEGSLWVAVRLPKDAELQVFHIPAAVSRLVEGRDFPARTEAGDPCGRIRVQEYAACHGHADFLRRAGADEGDILQVKFDLAKGQATLALIDDESLEEMSPTL